MKKPPKLRARIPLKFKRPQKIKSSLPNLITSGNLICGMIALILTVKGHLHTACWMLPLSVFFDFCDGMVARALGVSSDFGVEFDSLGDLVSFGVVPAIIVYQRALCELQPVAGIAIAVFYTLCGALRLARFNVTHVPAGPFQGLPIPAAALFLISLVLSRFSIPPALWGGCTVLAGVLMISSIPFGNLKGVTKDKADRHRVFSLALFLIVTLTLLRARSLMILASLYLISGLFNFNWSLWLNHEKKADDLD